MTATVHDNDLRKQVREFREIRRDYAFNPSVFNEEPEKLSRVKEIIARDLSKVDQVIFLSYVDCGSLRKLATRLGVSYVTLQKEIARIRKTILEKYDPSL